MANSPATSLSIASVGPSIGWNLELFDRALPYRPVTFGGRQRVEFTWYPGSPIATAQVLGPEEEPITLRGFWKDRFLTATSAQTITPDFAGTVQTTVQLVGIVDTMRRSGDLFRLTWDNLVRDGHITSFQQTWHNRHDCEWELEFTPISQGEQQTPIATPPQPQLSDVLASWEDASLRVQEAVSTSVSTTLGPVLQLNSVALAATNLLDDQVIGFTGAVQNIVTGVVNASLAGPDALNRIVALADGMKVQAEAIFFDVCNKADEAVFPLFEEPLPDALSLTEQVKAAVYKSDVQTAARGMRDMALQQQEEYLQTLNPDLLQTFLATQDTDLRDVSTQFYGRPDYWRDLLLFNRLGTSKLLAGELIFVPQLGNSGSGVAIPGAQP